MINKEKARLLNKNKVEVQVQYKIIIRNMNIEINTCDKCSKYDNK